jgi:hypothetical protein
MIRRDFQAPDGRNFWALVSQVEHARLSAEMARAWGSAECPPLDFADEMLPAIYRHDDGWAEWEQHPGVDPASGRPLNFTEMPLGESLEIWERSIAAAAQFGPLAGYVVSGHFVALLRHQNSWQQMGSPHQGQVSEFLDRQARRRIDWLAQWQRKSPAWRTATAAETSLQWLQFFDALSLWLCISRHVDSSKAIDVRKPELVPGRRLESVGWSAMPLPCGGQLRLVPQLSTPQHGEWIGLSPWPFSTASVDLSLSARCVPVQHYHTPAELADVLSTTVMLNWLLVPGPGEWSRGGENP